MASEFQFGNSASRPISDRLSVAKSIYCHHSHSKDLNFRRGQRSSSSLDKSSSMESNVCGASHYVLTWLEWASSGKTGRERSRVEEFKFD